MSGGGRLSGAKPGFIDSNGLNRHPVGGTRMRVTDFGGSLIPTRLEYGVRDVPHATLETNRTCNIGCRFCYNLDRSFVKSLDDIKAEVDLLLRTRNLQTLSILGGEPTLHPDLFQVIAYIKRKGVFCQLLTNGLILWQEGGNTYLEGLAQAGVDRILVHIDRGQADVYGDIEAARLKVFSRLEKKKMHFGLSLTIYDEDHDQLADLVRRYASNKFFDGILAILAREPMPPRVQTASLEDQYRSLRRNLGLEPSAFVASNLSEHDINWLIYHYFIDAVSGKPFSVSPPLDSTLRRAYRFITGREAFIYILPPAFARPALFLLTAAGSLLSPARALRRWRSALDALGGQTRLQFITIQEPPKFDEQTQRMRICHHCLDATIRNGRLTPVCLADRMSPLPGYESPDREAQDWSPEVFRHLEGREIGG